MTTSIGATMNTSLRAPIVCFCIFVRSSTSGCSAWKWIDLYSGVGLTMRMSTGVPNLCRSDVSLACEEPSP